MKKQVVLVPLVLVALTLGWALAPGSAKAGSDHNSGGIVGAWEVDAVGAPYVPHLATFHSDGTMSITNPARVQEDPSDPHGGTNDSIGMGTWKLVNDHGKKYVVGTFEELNAFTDNHEPTDTLSVSFKLTVHDDSFTGPAVAHLGPFSAPATLTGSRIVVDQDAVDTL